MLSKGTKNGLKNFILKKKINSKNIFLISKRKKSNCNILNLRKNIALTHKNNSSFNSLNSRDEKTKDMEIESDGKKSADSSLIMKENDFFINMDTSYGDNYSTANSITEIGKKNENKPLAKKIEYNEIDKSSEINNSFEVLMDNEEEPRKSPILEYIDEIFENLKNEEINNAYKINPDYFKFQIEINSKMRTILIDWLFEVNCKLKFKEETFFITVCIIDSYLSQKFVPRRKFQLLGVTALFIATKLNEIFTGSVRDYAFITDNAYKESEILDMEEDICKILNFNFLIPNCLIFFEIVSKKIGVDKDLKKYRFGKFIMQCFLMSSKSLNYNYSIISSATCYLVMKLFGNEKCLNLIDFRNFCMDNYKLVIDCCKNIWNEIKEILISYLNLSITKYYKENFDDDILKYISLYTE